MGRAPKDYADVYRICFSGKNMVNFLNFIYQNNAICLKRKLDCFEQYKLIRELELKNCRIKEQFNDPNQIFNWIKNKTYTVTQIAKLYCITNTTVYNRLYTAGLWQKFSQ